MTNWKSIRIAVGTAAVALALAASVHAFGVNHQNTLKFSRPVALPGVVLPAGTYSFDLVGSQSELDIVVVRETSSGKALYMGFTNTVQRPKGMSKDAAITFGEESANEPPPISRWYEIGDSLGHEFRYR